MQASRAVVVDCLRERGGHHSEAIVDRHVVAIATRFAMLPPEAMLPPADAGYPTRSATHRSSMFSMRTAPGPAKNTPAYLLVTAAT